MQQALQLRLPRAPALERVGHVMQRGRPALHDEGLQQQVQPRRAFPPAGAHAVAPAQPEGEVQALLVRGRQRLQRMLTLREEAEDRLRRLTHSTKVSTAVYFFICMARDQLYPRL